MNKKHLLESERLILRDLSLNDADAWFEIFNSDKVGQFLVKYDNKEDVEKLVTKKINKYANLEGSTYSAIEKTSNKIIGSVEIKFDSNLKEAEISYVFNENYWNKGYATESSLLLLDYAFNVLGAKKVIADCKENNIPSIHILQNKIGMTFIKNEPNYMFDETTQKHIGFNFYEITKSNYQKK